MVSRLYSGLVSGAAASVSSHVGKSFIRSSVTSAVQAPKAVAKELHPKLTQPASKAKDVFSPSVWAPLPVDPDPGLASRSDRLSPDSPLSTVSFGMNEGGEVFANVSKPSAHPEYVPRVAREKTKAKMPEEVDVAHAKKAVKHPEATPRLPVVGAKGKVKLDGEKQEVQVIGSDYRERPVVRTLSNPEPRIIRDPQDITALREAEQKSCFGRLRNAKVYKPNEKFRRVMEKALTNPIVGSKCGMDYIETLRSMGSEVFVLGGAVRDLLRAELLSDAEALKQVADVDVSVVGAAPTAVELCKRVHGDDPKIGKGFEHEFGGAHFKGPQGGDGFDYNAMMLGYGTYLARRSHPDTPGEKPVVPALFGGDPEQLPEALDFTQNSLLYDPVSGYIIDPTGRGVSDALSRLLILPQGDSLLSNPEAASIRVNPELIQRFWKFRYRGDTSNKYTTIVMQLTANRRWERMLLPEGKIDKGFYKDIAKMIPVKKLQGKSKEEMRKELSSMLDHLEEVMNDDDTSHKLENGLYQKWIAPRKQEIIDYIIATQPQTPPVLEPQKPKKEIEL